MNLKLNTFKKKLLVYFNSLIILFCIIIGILVTILTNNAVYNTLNSVLPEVTKETVNYIDTRIKSKLNLLNTVANVNEIADKTIPVEEKLEQLKKYLNKDDWTRLGISDLSGNTTFTDGTVVNISNQEYFNSALSENGIVTGPIDDFIIYATPINIDNEVAGLLVGQVSLLSLNNITDEISFGETGKAFIVDENGTTIAHYDKNFVKNKFNIIDEDKKHNPSSSMSSLTKNNKIKDFNYDNVDKYVVYKDIPAANWTLGLTINKSEVLKESMGIAKNILIVDVIAIAVSFIIILFISSKFSSNINLIVKHLNIISKGDLSQDTPKKLLQSKDEFSSISNAIKEMQSSTVSTIKVIQEDANLIDEQSENLSALSEEIASSIESITASINEVAKGTESQAHDLTDIVTIFNDFNSILDIASNSLEDVKISTNKIKDMANSSKKDTSILVESVEKFTSSFKELLGKIHNVENTISKISEITSLIKNISNQTNLLALNAAIEAARAGDSGKGFAIVADEIRKLAEQSKVSSDNIAALIANVYEDSELMIKTTDIVNEELINEKNSISTVLNSFNDINNALDDISPKVDKTIELASEINSKKVAILDKIQSTSSVSEETSAIIQEIASNSLQISNSSTDIASSAENLNAMTNKMRDVSSSFKIE